MPSYARFGESEVITETNPTNGPANHRAIIFYLPIDHVESFRHIADVETGSENPRYVKSSRRTLSAA